tara:strand:- start:1646 stop:2452 length:807 start_codon:yes stop_codon:yes gene_type:complete
MKKLIKKILKEEVHPEFDFIDEGEELLPFRLPELKIMMATLKRMGVNNGVTNENKHIFIDILKKTFGINDDVVLSKMVLIGFFNTITDLFMAFKNNDPGRLYNGPFYISTLDYWDEEYSSDEELENESCDNCQGSGEDEESCASCDGEGHLGDEEEEGYSIDCDTCDGTGRENIDCGECGGEGAVEVEKTIFMVDNWEMTLITTQHMDIDEVKDTYQLIKDDDILTGDKKWLGEFRDDTAGSMLDYVGESEITDQDIIVKTETIVNLL